MINIMPKPGIKNAISGPTLPVSYYALNYLRKQKRREEMELSPESSDRTRPPPAEWCGGGVVSYYTPLVTTTETCVMTLLPTGHRDSA